MTTEDDGLDDDEFDGIQVNGPWGGVRVGSGGFRGGRGPLSAEDREVRRVRRRVRRRLDLYRNLAIFAAVVGALALLDGTTGGGWWVQWVAGIWGGILFLQFFGTFVGPALWGRDVEERMVARELERQRGRVHVTHPPEQT